MPDIRLPIIYVENRKWILLKSLSKRFLIRAVHIDPHPRENPDPSDHCRFETHAEGSVKVQPTKDWDFYEYLKKQKRKEEEGRGGKEGKRSQKKKKKSR